MSDIGIGKPFGAKGVGGCERGGERCQAENPAQPSGPERKVMGTAIVRACCGHSDEQSAKRSDRNGDKGERSNGDRWLPHSDHPQEAGVV
jgi:hypothetical protein